MRRYLGVFLFLTLVGSLNAFADAVSCQTTFLGMTTANQYPTYCPFNYASTGRPSVIHLKDFNCASDPIGPSPVSDRTCWQQALNCAFNPAVGAFLFGTIEATEGINYLIDDTICLVGAQNGVIKGNGARLTWIGSNSALTPMFYFGSDQQMRIENMRIVSFPSPGSPMHTAMVFGSREGSIVSHQNHLEDISINGVDTGSLQYGIRFAGPSSYAGNPLGLWDANNDLFTLDTLSITGVDKAGISIEHSQSLEHHLMNVELYASGGNAGVDSDDCLNTNFDQQTQSCLPNTMIKGASGVRVKAGSFDSYGGFVWNFANAAYFIDGAQTMTIFQHHSEACGRLIRTQDGNVGFNGIVAIYGGRYAADDINPDKRIIEWYRFGPLRIQGLLVSRETGTGELKFYVNPQSVSEAPNAMAEVDISHINVFIPGAASWSDIIDLANPTRTHLVAIGNQCKGTNDLTATCPGYGGGSDQAVAVLKNKNLEDASNTFPSTFVTTTGAQTVSGKDLTTGNTFPNTLVTLTGSQTLTNKTLTDSTNVFPGLGMLAFTNAKAISTAKSRFLGPNTGEAVPTTNTDATTDVTVAVPFPALTVRQFACSATAAPGSNKSWTMTLFVNGSATGSSCVISGTATPSTCSQTLAASVSAGGTVSVKIQPSASAPASATVLCSLRTAN